MGASSQWKESHPQPREYWIDSAELEVVYAVVDLCLLGSLNILEKKRRSKCTGQGIGRRHITPCYSRLRCGAGWPQMATGRPSCGGRCRWVCWGFSRLGLLPSSGTRHYELEGSVLLRVALRVQPFLKYGVQKMGLCISICHNFSN
jgi:hypothetical protein